MTEARRERVRPHVARSLFSHLPRPTVAGLVRALIGLLAIAALLAVLLPAVVVPPLDLKVGEIVPDHVYAPPGFVFRDWSSARAAAAEAVPPRWGFDAVAAAENIRILGEIGLAPEEREALRGYLDREPQRRERFEGIPYEVVGPERVDRALRRRRIPEWRRAEILAVLRPSIVVDAPATEAARRSWVEAHPPAPQVFPSTVPVLPAGTRLDERGMEIVRQIDAYRSASSLLAATGLGAYLAVVLALCYLYLRRYAPALIRRTKDVGAIALVIVLTITADVLVRAAAPAIVLPGGFRFTRSLAPIAATPMLLSILFGARLASIMTVFVSILFSAGGSGRLDIAAANTLGGIAAAFAVAGARRREALFAAGGLAGLTQAVVLVAHSMIRRVPDFPTTDALSSLLGGAVLAPFIVLGSLQLFERLFGLTTNFRLLELSDLNHPVLRRMLLEAPGTYDHSIRVASLAEVAAEAIGANSLLARVGCYFHDIGKIAQPEYFTENQAAGENPHEGLKPSLSAQILQAHVKDGMAMAQEMGLPEAVARFIPEHHGTSLMAFFYNKALEEAAPGETVDREEFRYDGPRPQLQETAIAMLADSVEAACRALQKPSAVKIDRTVRTVINQRFTDGELDECDITLKDLHRIAESFTRVLCGMYHARTVEYPEGQEIAEAERRARRAVNGAGTAG